MESKLQDISGDRFNTFTYKWTINTPVLNETLYSDPFETDPNINWKVYFDARCTRGQPESCGLIFLGCSVLGPYFRIAVEFQCLLDNPIQSASGTPTTIPLCEKRNGTCDSVYTDIGGKIFCNLDDNLKQSSLKLIFRIKTRKRATFTIPRSTLLQDLDVANQVLTDVKLNGLKAHKEILASRCPVFAAMFKTDMMEKQQNSITISDIYEEELKQLLKYIYTDRAEVTRETASLMLAAADKYGLARLKAACEHAVYRSVSVDTAIDTLILADKHNAQQLKTHMLHFIATNNNGADVMRSKKWENLVNDHPQLLLEVYRSIGKR